MLHILRKKKNTKKIWIILAIVIIPTFVMWGSGVILRGDKKSAYAGRIFGRKVSFSEYADALSGVKNQAVMRFGDKFPEIQKSLNLESQAWERLILLYEAKIRRIEVSDKEVIEFIQGYPFFQKNGRFDQNTYNQLLEYYFRTPARVFEEQARQNLILSRLVKEITDGVKLSDEEIKEEYKKLNEEVSIYYLAAIFADFAKSQSPCEEELKNYYAKNQMKFKQPFSFNLEYISVTAQAGEEKAGEEKIKTIAWRLARKKELSKIAKEFGLEPKETGLFPEEGPIPGIGWSPQIINLVSKLKTGGFSPIIPIDKAYYIFRLKDKKEPYVPEFETIKDKVKEALIKDNSRTLARKDIEDTLKKLKETYKTNPKSVDFGKTAKESGLKSDSTALFKYGSYIEGIGASDSFWLSARNLKEDEPSEIITTPEGFYIIKLKSRTSIDEKKFGGEKPQFSQQFLLQKKEEILLKFLDTLRKKALAANQPL